MKNTIKKIVATISAAAMCAIPMANALTADAAISPNARYTFRKVYYVANSANIKDVVFRWIINSNGTSAPQAHTLAPGQLINGNTGGQNRHVGAGTYSPTNHYVTGAIFTQSFFSNTTSPTEYGNYIEVYNNNNQQLYDKVKAYDKYLVGDINNDGIINGSDASLLDNALNNTNISSKKLTDPVKINGVTYRVYKFDIDNDGDVDSADLSMILQYNMGPDHLLRFPQ